jgi:hypothetical protein
MNRYSKAARTPPAVNELHSPVAEAFSLTRGGPLYRLQLRLGAAREERFQVVQRALIATLVTWLPLLLLSAAQGLVFGKHPQVPFLKDFAVHVRFLIALPMLIVSEIWIDPRLGITVNHFLKSGLIKEADLPSFEAVVEKVTRLRDRMLPEVLILMFAYLPSLSIHNPEIFIRHNSSWHFVQTSSGETLSYAGWWFGLISVCAYRFLLIRWAWRMLLWASFLWNVSKLNLILIPTHPDMAAGIGFLSEAQLRFGLIAFACGAVIAGQLANTIAYDGATVGGLKFAIIAYCVIATLFLAAPLLLLVPTLRPVKIRGLLEYGALANGYTQTFDAKWVHGRWPEGETLLGSADIQSLADLGNSFAIVREMRVVPIDKGTLMGLAVAAVLPMVPVLILGTPADQLIRTVVKLVA